MKKRQTSQQIITRQAKEIYRLRDEVIELEKSLNAIRTHIICIGGPLNDNRLRYTKEQLEDFLYILNLTED